MKKKYSFVVLVVLFLMPMVLRAQDSATITIAVNDSTMGTTNPAPGTYTYADEEEYSVTAIPNAGYQLLGWTITYVYYGQTYTEPLDEANMTITGHADADPYMTSYTITAIFGPDNNISDSLTVVVGVNDPNAGAVTPAPGTYNYGVGETFSVSAAPNEGYRLAGWHVTVAHPVYGIIQDAVMDAPDDASFATINVEVDEYIVGYVHTFIALFESINGIEDATPVAVNAYGCEGRIILNGAEGREVNVFDISGRVLYHSYPANAIETYSVPITGIYLVNVAGVGTKRVMVIR